MRSRKKCTFYLFNSAGLFFFTSLPESKNVCVSVSERGERERRKREREVTFNQEGGSSESNSFRAPRVLRAWERGELFFPAKKERGSNNTVLQRGARALQRQRAATTRTRTGPGALRGPVHS